MLPSLSQVLALPGTVPRRVTDGQIDGNGHVSVRFHVEIAAHGAHELLRACGVTDAQRAATGRTVFTVEHHLHYLAEIEPDARLTVHTRIVDRTKKAVVMQAFVVDLDRTRVATTLRTVVVSVDLTTRRSTPFPADIACNIDRLLAEHSRLPWRTS